MLITTSPYRSPVEDYYNMSHLVDSFDTSNSETRSEMIFALRSIHQPLLANGLCQETIERVKALRKFIFDNGLHEGSLGLKLDLEIRQKIIQLECVTVLNHIPLYDHKHLKVLDKYIYPSHIEHSRNSSSTISMSLYLRVAYSESRGFYDDRNSKKENKIKIL